MCAYKSFKVVNDGGDLVLLASSLLLSAASHSAIIRQHTKHTIKFSQLKASNLKNDLKLSAQFDMLIW
jgi:hypothetical protein